MSNSRFVPFTPGGSFLANLARGTEEAAWKALEHATTHMPYKNRDELKARGYEIIDMDRDVIEVPAQNNQETTK